MVDFLGLCRLLKNKCPFPCKAEHIKPIIDNYLCGNLLDRDQQRDLVKIIIKNWDKNINELARTQCDYFKNSANYF